VESLFPPLNMCLIVIRGELFSLSLNAGALASNQASLDSSTGPPSGAAPEDGPLIAFFQKYSGDLDFVARVDLSRKPTLNMDEYGRVTPRGETSM